MDCGTVGKEAAEAVTWTYLSFQYWTYLSFQPFLFTLFFIYIYNFYHLSSLLYQVWTCDTKLIDSNIWSSTFLWSTASYLFLKDLIRISTKINHALFLSSSKNNNSLLHLWFSINIHFIMYPEVFQQPYKQAACNWKWFSIWIIIQVVTFFLIKKQTHSPESKCGPDYFREKKEII